MTETFNIAGYARISVDDEQDRDNISIENQKAIIEEYVKGRLTMDKVKSSMDEVDIHFIQDDEDPRPYKHFKKFYTVARLMRNAYIAKERKAEAAAAALEVSDEESGS